MTQTNYKNWLLIDYDDTLGGVLIQNEVCNTNYAYKHAIDTFVGLMESQHGFAPEFCRRTQERVETELFKEHGFSVRDIFAQALVVAYYYISNVYGVSTIPAVEESVFAIGQSVFDYPYVALPGALDTLAALRPNYNIAIVTKGNTVEQNKKVNNSGVKRFVDKVYTVGRKDERDWGDVTNDLNLNFEDLTRTWAIGNSAKGDVNVPIRMGMNGIWVEQGDWAFESETLASPAPGRHLYKVNTIKEILRYL